MRDTEELEVAKEALENRLEQYSHPLLIAFNQPKREVIVAVLHGDKDPQELHDNLISNLRHNLSLAEFVQFQAGINAAAFAAGDLDSI